MGRIEVLEAEEKQGEELHQRLYGGGEAATETAGEGETPAESEGSDEGTEGEGGPSPEAKATTPTAPAEGAEPAAPAADPSLQEKYDKLTQQHRVLQGKYNAEVPRMHAEMKTLKAELEKLKATPPATAAAPAPDPEDDIEQKVKDNYGEEYLTTFRSLVDARVDRAVSEKMAEIEQRIGSVTDSIQKSEGEKYVDKLTQLVPYWPEYVNDFRFAEYLNNMEPLSGRTYYDLANEAMVAHDAPRVARFYEAFHKSIGGNGASAVAPAAQKVAAAPNKSSLAEPKPRTGSPPPASKKDNDGWVTTTEMDEFTHRSQTGYYRTRPEEFAREEARINKAIAERKIRP